MPGGGLTDGNYKNDFLTNLRCQVPDWPRLRRRHPRKGLWNAKCS